jgi:hypothetical protein
LEGYGIAFYLISIGGEIVGGLEEREKVVGWCRLKEGRGGACRPTKGRVRSKRGRVICLRSGERVVG